MTHKPHLFEGLPHYFESLGMILHYTCNSPSCSYLEKEGLIARGKDFDSDPTEIVEIPIAYYNKKGYSETLDKNILKINCEKIMRNLGNEEILKNKKLEDFI